MKQMKMQVFYWVFVILSVLSAASCNKSNNQPGEELTDNLLKSAEKYAALVEERHSAGGAFDIDTITRFGNKLTIAIKGGCTESDFKLVWDGAIMLSNPGQVNLVLYNDDQETCGGDKKYYVDVDLSKVLGAHDPGSLIVHVANASKRQDLSLHPNGNVTWK